MRISTQDFPCALKTYLQLVTVTTYLLDHANFDQAMDAVNTNAVDAGQLIERHLAAARSELQALKERKRKIDTEYTTATSKLQLVHMHHKEYMDIKAKAKVGHSLRAAAVQLAI